MTRFHTGRPQGVELEVEALVFGRRPGIANQFSHGVLSSLGGMCIKPLWALNDAHRLMHGLMHTKSPHQPGTAPQLA
jgi:hypothetical protein